MICRRKHETCNTSKFKNSLKLLPSGWKPFFDTVISKFADLVIPACPTEVKENAWMPKRGSLILIANSASP